jgi:hypothetical protein
MRIRVLTAMLLVLSGTPALAGDLSDLVQANRMTVLAVDKPALKVRCILHNWMDVSAAAVVYEAEGRQIGLGDLKAGDVIKTESNAGQIQKIVVLRRGSDETASVER